MYSNPVKVIISDDWIEDCFRYQRSLGMQKPIIITSQGSVERNRLSKTFKGITIFSEVNSDPTSESCQNAIDILDLSKFDGVIAIGGGSVMDTAKVLKAVMSSKITNLKKLMDLSNFEESKKVPSIFVPSTHGTGSEVTKWGTVWDLSEKKKYSISHAILYPDISILDPSITLSLPLKFSLITTLDALSHSFEAIWNKNNNKTSTSYAIEAIISILKNVEAFKANPSDLKLRKELLIASKNAGMAFSNTKTAAAHSISYPLTIHYNIPHGIASSMSLIPLLEINREAIQESLEEIYKRMRISHSQLVQMIELIPNNVLPYSLSEWGISKDSISQLINESFTKGRMDNNIIDLDKNHLKHIFNMMHD